MRADAERNRQRVLAAAKELIERDGPSVPLDDIARAAGVGPGTLHRHFPSKRALLAAVIMDRLTTLTDQLTGLADSERPGEALMAAVTRMLDEGDVSEPVKAALVGTDFDLERDAPEATERLHAALDRLLRAAQQAGEIRTDVNVHDLISLVAAAFIAEQRRPARGKPHHLTTIIFDGLRR